MADMRLFVMSLSHSHPLIPLCLCLCMCVCVCLYVCECVCSHWSIPGLKLVPARSPNGSIDHCSVPFSNQRTAVVESSTQEITHFNEESVIIFSLQRGEGVKNNNGEIWM